MRTPPERNVQRIMHGPLRQLPPQWGALMITPETLSKDEVESLIDRAHPNGEGLDPNHAPDRRLIGDIRAWLRWESTGRRGSPPYFASRAIAAALNHREQGGT